MKFTSLRIAGFKSFVDPVELHIRPGLTGVVGPNGCGKSNLMEAMRWVMGANSAKAMRAGGMDDVIFAGTDSRPPRNHAEVALTLDNADRGAPSLFNDADQLEVVRRITRGGGSVYKVNGKETRARDVQLLFADASSGANSPALVRQGQISDLIAAKPQNRRKVLEEAAGVAGLHSRRREAELRLNAAETNLARLDDAIGASERELDGLRRQARQAKRYRRVSDDIRALELRIRQLARAEAETARADAATAKKEAEAQVEAAVKEAGAASAEAAERAAALPPIREEEALASTLLARLTAAKDAIDQEMTRAQAAIEAAARRVSELDADLERERTRLGDAEESLARAEVAGEHDEDAPTEKALAGLKRAADKADAVRAEAEAELEARTKAFSELQAARAAAERALTDARARLERITREADAAEQTEDAVAAAEENAARDSAEADLAKAAAARTRAANAAEKSGVKAAGAAADEREAGEAFRAAERALAEVRAEVGAMRAMDAREGGTDWESLADVARPAAGYEIALAAALGEEMVAGLSDVAPRWWAKSEVTAPPLPEGVSPLSECVEAPEALGLRLEQTGVVEPDDGPRLAIKLHPGQQLVTRDGAVWRWDGYRVAAGAPSPAAARLERRARIEELAKTEADYAADADAANERWSKAKAQLNQARTAAQAASDKARAADSAERDARKTLEAAERACATRAARDADARAARERLAQEIEETSTRIAALESDLAALADPKAAETERDGARDAAESARAKAAKASGKADAAEAARAAAERRAAERAQECDRWRQRVDAARTHLEELTARRAEAASEHEAAEKAPAEIDSRAKTLSGELGKAETRARKARDAFSEADTTARAADQRARRAEADLATARAAVEAAEENARTAYTRLTEAAEALRVHLKEHNEAPDQLDADPSGPDREQSERKLERLKGERDALGSVNLAADDEAAEREKAIADLNGEREDLMSAVSTLRGSIAKLDADARTRLREAFEVINERFAQLFHTLFGGGEAKLALVDSDDPLEAGLDIHVSPPGKKLGSMSLLSGGEQALTATALIFAVFLANPAPVCALDEVDAPLDDTNTDRFCRLLAEMTRLTDTRFLVITHNPVTMSRVDRLFGVTMAEAGVSQLVSVDLRQAEHLVAAE